MPVNLLHDNNAVFRGRLHVHVVHTGPSAADDLQTAGRVDDLGRDLCRRPHYQSVIVLWSKHTDQIVNHNNQRDEIMLQPKTCNRTGFVAESAHMNSGYVTMHFARLVYKKGRINVTFIVCENKCMHFRCYFCVSLGLLWNMWQTIGDGGDSSSKLRMQLHQIQKGRYYGYPQVR